MLSYNEYIRMLYPEDKLDSCRDITIQVCDDCCLSCSYCYQICKGHNYMTKETAKKTIDLLFKMYEEDDRNNFINKTTHGIVIDFIGGEPFMNIDVIDYATTYLLDRCIKEEHEWLCNFRISFATNGILYFDEKVQDYLSKFHDFVSLTVSIDGPKDIHDTCRKDANGNGSFDMAYKAMKHWHEHYNKENNKAETKVTIAPENLHDLNKIVDFFMDNGVKVIFANPIYEAEWTVEQAAEYYKELKILADKLLTHPEITCSIFDKHHNTPKKTTDNQNWCGGDGNMCAFGPDGRAYPCLRYMESSLGNSVPALVIGDVEQGIYQTDETKELKKQLNAMTRESQSTEECFHCPIASGCAWCSAYNYQSKGKLNIRNTNICWMHRASSIANVYYWNMKYIIEGSERRLPFFLEQKYALQIISPEEYNALLELSSY